jgi:hypothetical protein
MKTFREFILECYSLLFEAPKPPDYNYEEAFVRLYNYLTGSEDRKNKIGRQMRALIHRSAGDSAEAADAMNDIISLIIKEVSNAETDPNHPLHFENAPDNGFTKGKKIDDEEYKQAYYEKLNNQKYTFLNFIGSKSGRIMAARGLIAVRAGNEKIPLTTRGAKVYEKSSDTSKADVVFKDGITGEILHTSSLKDVQGSVSASSGPKETKGNLLMAMYAVLNLRLKNNEINQKEYDELKESGKILASEIALKMTTKGLSREEVSGIVDPKIDSRGLFSTMGNFENLFPGVTEYLAKEQITGKGKYGQGVDSVLKTGKGGELIEFPEFLSAFVKQRPRPSKHGSQGNAVYSADNLRVPENVDRPKADPESLYNITASRQEMEMKRAGDRIIADLQSGESKTLDQFQQDARRAQQGLEASAAEVAQAEQEKIAADTEVQNASVAINPDTGLPFLKQYRKNVEAHIAAGDPTSQTAALNTEIRTNAQNNQAAADANLSQAQSNQAAAQANMDQIAAQSSAQQSRQSVPPEQQPVPAPAAPTQPQPTQPTQQTQPAPEQPQPTQPTQQTEPAPEQQQQQPAPEQQKPKPKKKKPEPENTETGGQAPQ